MVAGLLGGPGRSQRKGQGDGHNTWGEVAGWGNDYVLTSSEVPVGLYVHTGKISSLGLILKELDGAYQH